MEKIEYEKPELKELDADRGEGFCGAGYADLDFCSAGPVAGDFCSVGVGNGPHKLTVG